MSDFGERMQRILNWADEQNGKPVKEQDEDSECDDIDYNTIKGAIDYLQSVYDDIQDSEIIKRIKVKVELNAEMNGLTLIKVAFSSICKEIKALEKPKDKLEF
jgi:hypothetical protein